MKKPSRLVIRFIQALLILFLIILPTVLLIRYVAKTSADSTQHTASPRSSSSPLAQGPPVNPTPDFSAFAGTWISHSAELTFAPNGQAKFIARTYQWCGPGVPLPCDSIQGNTIVSGIMEEMMFTRVVGSTAYGAITSSNIHSRGYAVSITRHEGDTVTYSGYANVSVLCGPDSPPGWCGA